jgi:hypothetical protein
LILQRSAIVSFGVEAAHGLIGLVYAAGGLKTVLISYVFVSRDLIPSNARNSVLLPTCGAALIILVIPEQIEGLSDGNHELDPNEFSLRRPVRENDPRSTACPVSS